MPVFRLLNSLPVRLRRPFHENHVQEKNADNIEMVSLQQIYQMFLPTMPV